MSKQMEAIRQESRQILNNWLISCTRDGKISSNTVAMGIVVIDHMRKKCPLPRGEVVSKGGEIKGARSGLVNILETYDIPGSYLKEVTTRQAREQSASARSK